MQWSVFNSLLILFCKVHIASLDRVLCGAGGLHMLARASTLEPCVWQFPSAVYERDKLYIRKPEHWMSWRWCHFACDEGGCGATSSQEARAGCFKSWARTHLTLCAGTHSKSRVRGHSTLCMWEPIETPGKNWVSVDWELENKINTECRGWKTRI